MKKKFILVMLGLIMLLGLAACHAPLSLKDVEEQNRDKWHVTYDLQGGVFNSQEAIDISHYYPKKEGGTYISEPKGKESALGSLKITRSGYFLEGWYKTKECEVADKWDFSNDKITGDTVLYAKWLKNYEFRFLYRDEGDGEWKEIPDSGVTVDGDLSDETTGYLDNTHKPKREGYTFIEWYANEECSVVWDKNTDRHSGKVVNGDNEASRVVNIYTVWRQGVWAIVQTANEFANAIAANQNIYLYKDIEFGDVNEFTGANWTTGEDEYDKTIDGNHKSVKNIVMSFPDSAAKDNRKRPAYCGIFRKLADGAVLKNISFENISLNIKPDSITWNKYCALLAAEVEEGVTFENVTLTGTLAVTHTKAINNYYFGAVSGSFPQGALLTGIDFSGVAIDYNYTGTETAYTYELDALGVLWFS